VWAPSSFLRWSVPAGGVESRSFDADPQNGEAEERADSALRGGAGILSLVQPGGSGRRGAQKNATKGSGAYPRNIQSVRHERREENGEDPSSRVAGRSGEHGFTYRQGEKTGSSRGNY